MSDYDVCPGCGRWVMSAEFWQFKGTMHFTDEELAKYEAEETLYKSQHGDCKAHRWTVMGSLTMHCGKCCPPPPLNAKLNRPGGEGLASLKESYGKLFGDKP